jgi:hypothetical protein
MDGITVLLCKCILKKLGNEASMAFVGVLTLCGIVR